MFEIFNTLRQSRGFHVYLGSVSQMPIWARLILGLITFPAILLVILCFIVFLVSILTLFILALPPYFILRWITGVKTKQVVGEGYSFDAKGRAKKVNVTVIK